jgi:hypothetical protein
LDGTSDFTISMAAPHTNMVVTPMIITTTDALIRIASSARWLAVAAYSGSPPG